MSYLALYGFIFARSASAVVAALDMVIYLAFSGFYSSIGKICGFPLSVALCGLYEVLKGLFIRSGFVSASR